MQMIVEILSLPFLSLKIAYTLDEKRNTGLFKPHLWQKWIYTYTLSVLIFAHHHFFAKNRCLTQVLDVLS